VTEHAITLTITRLLTARGAWWVKVHGSGIARAGVPDLIAIYKGRALALEVKQPGETPSRIQLYELRRAEIAGAVIAVVTTAGQVAEILDALDRTEA
jgi:Holliday junction resolvase